MPNTFDASSVMQRIAEIQADIMATNPQAVFTQVNLGITEYEALAREHMFLVHGSLNPGPPEFQGMRVHRLLSPSQITLVYHTGVSRD